jgi:hypothetical protein
MHKTGILRITGPFLAPDRESLRFEAFVNSRLMLVRLTAFHRMLSRLI